MENRTPNSQHSGSRFSASTGSGSMRTPITSLHSVSVEIKSVELPDVGGGLMNSVYCTLKAGGDNGSTQFMSSIVTRRGSNSALYTFDNGANGLKNIPLGSVSSRYALISVHAQAFDGEKLGEASIALASGKGDAIHKVRTTLFRKGKKAGEVRCVLTRPVEDFLDDNASEDGDQASATPSPCQPSSTLRRSLNGTPRASMDYLLNSSTIADPSPILQKTARSDSPRVSFALPDDDGFPESTALTRANLDLHCTSLATAATSTNEAQEPTADAKVVPAATEVQTDEKDVKIEFNGADVHETMLSATSVSADDKCDDITVSSLTLSSPVLLPAEPIVSAPMPVAIDNEVAEKRALADSPAETMSSPAPPLTSESSDTLVESLAATQLSSATVETLTTDVDSALGSGVGEVQIAEFPAFSTTIVTAELASTPDHNNVQDDAVRVEPQLAVTATPLLQPSARRPPLSGRTALQIASAPGTASTTPMTLASNTNSGFKAASSQKVATSLSASSLSSSLSLSTSGSSTTSSSRMLSLAEVKRRLHSVSSADTAPLATTTTSLSAKRKQQPPATPTNIESSLQQQVPWQKKSTMSYPAPDDSPSSSPSSETWWTWRNLPAMLALGCLIAAMIVSILQPDPAAVSTAAANQNQQQQQMGFAYRLQTPSQAVSVQLQVLNNDRGSDDDNVSECLRWVTLPRSTSSSASSSASTSASADSSATAVPIWRRVWQFFQRPVSVLLRRLLRKSATPPALTAPPASTPYSAVAGRMRPCGCDQTQTAGFEEAEQQRGEAGWWKLLPVSPSVYSQANEAGGAFFLLSPYASSTDDETGESAVPTAAQCLSVHPQHGTGLTDCNYAMPDTLWTLQRNTLVAWVPQQQTKQQQQQYTMLEPRWTWEASYRGPALTFQAMNMPKQQQGASDRHAVRIAAVMQTTAQQTQTPDATGPPALVTQAVRIDSLVY